MQANINIDPSLSLVSPMNYFPKGSMNIDRQQFVQYITVKKRLSPNSVRNYAGRFEIIKRWLIKNESKLTKQSVEDFVYEKKEKEKLSNAAINTYIQTFNHMEGFCKDKGLSSGFTEGMVSLPKVQSEIVPLSSEELDRLQNIHLKYKNRNGVSCDNLDENYSTIISFMINTGLRFEEAASLKVKRLDIENGRATIVNTKNKQNRFVFIHAMPLKEALRKLIKDKNPDDLVFTNSKNQHILPGDFNNDLRLRAKKTGITKYVHAHILRHSYATELYKATHDITIVASILGHKDIQTTYQTYVHLDTETLERNTQRLPLLRKYVLPREIMREIKTFVDDYRLSDDERFSYNVSIGDKGLEIKIKSR